MVATLRFFIAGLAFVLRTARGAAYSVGGRLKLVELGQYMGFKDFSRKMAPVLRLIMVFSFSLVLVRHLECVLRVSGV